MNEADHLLRLTGAAYADGIGDMVTGADPVAVSRVVFDQSGDMPNELGASDLFVTWGQFIDHDLSLTPDASGEFVASPGLVAPLQRSVYDQTTGIDSPREHLNVITPGIDANMVYGSDATREAMLRSFEGGKLILDEMGMMPLAMVPGTMAGTSPDNPLFLAGDVRANENTGLTTLHTLFVREHNYWAERLSDAHPDWNDQAIFTAARSIVEAEVQKITYADWLPQLIGDAAIAPAHDPDADGRISTEFSTAGFRFGHTMVSQLVERIEEDGATSANGHITVMEAFFNNDPMKQDGIDAILRGQAGSSAQMSDAKMIDDLNMFLTSPDGTTGFSLAALNILRGRDHGLDTYIEVRAALLGDIDPATIDPQDFSLITSDAAVAAELATVYDSVMQVDLWVGGLAEDNIAGTQLGPLFTHIVAEQFARTAAADESFGVLAAALGPDIAAEVAETTLADIMVRNSGIDHLQADVFTFANRMGGDDGRDLMKGTSGADLMLGFGGNDQLRGGQGDDSLFGGSGRDHLRGNRGDDHLDGGDGRDKLHGGWGADALDGGAGRDRLIGGRGDDRLDGGADNDLMIGGGGDDTFLFRVGSGDDRVADFRSGQDLIHLDGFGIDSFGELEALISHKGRQTVIDLGDDSLTLMRVKPWQLDADDFAFS